MKSLIVIGASGVGKGTIIKHLLSRRSELELVLSFTTRASRPAEIDGIDYFFVSEAEFEERKGQMLESKQVFKNSYGTSHEHLRRILAQGKVPVLDIDIEGMMDIRGKIECEVLCILPASWALLRERLSGRRTESEAELGLRMAENSKQVEKMLGLQGEEQMWFVTNYQYQSTCFGVLQWMESRFAQLRNCPD